MNEIYNCPICGNVVRSIPGTQLDPKDGITVYCANKSCSMADWGHGKNEKDAFEIFIQKCGKRN